jgi:branched-chain amino acid transport system substrate-binding protein
MFLKLYEVINMKNNIRLTALLISITIIGLSLIIGCKQKPNEILIGAIMPITGDAAVYGKNCKQGIELAVEEINSKGGVKGVPLKIIFEDDLLQPKAAVGAFEKLVSIDKVLAVLGPLASSCAMATAPLANQKKIVSFSPGASTPKLTDAGPYVFRDWQSDALEAVIMAEHAISQGWNKLAIFYVNNDFGVSLKDYFIKKIEAVGGKILITETFEQGATDFKTQLSKIKESLPGAIYLLSYPQQTPIIINQIKALKIHAQLLGVAAMEDPSLLKIAGKNAEGLQYTVAVPLSDDESVRKNFLNNYEKKFGEKPGLISDNGYDAVYILSKAIEQSKELTGESIQNSLSQIKEWRGASGLMKFDQNGDVIKPIGIKIVSNGEFVWLQK